MPRRIVIHNHFARDARDVNPATVHIYREGDQYRVESPDGRRMIAPSEEAALKMANSEVRRGNWNGAIRHFE